jgi:hypothetical protein
MALVLLDAVSALISANDFSQSDHADECLELYMLITYRSNITFEAQRSLAFLILRCPSRPFTAGASQAMVRSAVTTAWLIFVRESPAALVALAWRGLSDSVAISALAKKPIGLFVAEKKTPQTIFFRTFRSAGAILGCFSCFPTLSAFLGVEEALCPFVRSVFEAVKAQPGLPAVAEGAREAGLGDAAVAAPLASLPRALGRHPQGPQRSLRGEHGHLRLLHGDAGLVSRLGAGAD